MHPSPPMPEEIKAGFYPDFEHGWRKAEPAGRTVMLLAVCATLAGLLGGGPVSIWTRHAKAGTLEIEYSPVIRFGTPTGLVLPGDNADDGTAEQFQLVRDAVAPLRLATDAGQVVRDAFAVRAKVLGDAPITSVEAQVDDGRWVPMARAPGQDALWEARCETPGDVVRVRARDGRERTDQDAVEPARPGWTVPEGAGDGSDRNRVGAWPERGILDTQLGPNRNGKQW